MRQKEKCCFTLLQYFEEIVFFIICSKSNKCRNFFFKNIEVVLIFHVVCAKSLAPYHRYKQIRKKKIFKPQCCVFRVTYVLPTTFGVYFTFFEFRVINMQSQATLKAFKTKAYLKRHRLLTPFQSNLIAISIWDPSSLSTQLTNMLHFEEIPLLQQMPM